jgi:hypothetical protein
MSGARQTNQHLDKLIDEITVDCCDAEEQLRGFENAFTRTPVSGVRDPFVERVDIMHIGHADGRRELIATCRHAGRRYDIAPPNISDIRADPPGC